MITQQLPPSRRDLLLMTGVAGFGALAAARPTGPMHLVQGHAESVIVDVRDHGATGDGRSDDSNAVGDALAVASANRSSATLYFPRGDYRIRAGLLEVADGKSMIIRGDGPVATRIMFLEDESAPKALVTLNAAFSAVEDLQLDGGGASNGAELLVMNRGYNRVSNCYLSRSPGTGIAIGKTDSAIAHIIENLIIRDSKDYGIRVHGVSKTDANGSTDGLWSNVDVGRSGLSGIFVESSSQNMSNVHVWQSGIADMDGADAHGFRITTRAHIFNGCQSETNLGDGFRFEKGGGERCVVNGCRVWENGGSGLTGVNAHHLTVAASTFMRNGRNNVGDAASKTSAQAAAIHNDGGDGWAVTGCSAWDDGESLKAVQVPKDPSAPQVPSRGSQMTQTYAYVETGDSGRSTITGGVLRAEDHLSGHAILSSAPLLLVSGADLGDDDSPTVQSSESLALPAWGDIIAISGTTRINSIRVSRPGRIVTLLFLTDEHPGITGSGSSLRLGSPFSPRAGSTITIGFFGGVWYEQSRTG